MKPSNKTIQALPILISTMNEFPRCFCFFSLLSMWLSAPHLTCAYIHVLCVARGTTQHLLPVSIIRQTTSLGAKGQLEPQHKVCHNFLKMPVQSSNGKHCPLVRNVRGFHLFPSACPVLQDQKHNSAIGVVNYCLLQIGMLIQHCEVFCTEVFFLFS